MKGKYSARSLREPVFGGSRYLGQNDSAPKRRVINQGGYARYSGRRRLGFKQ